MVDVHKLLQFLLTEDTEMPDDVLELMAATDQRSMSILAATSEEDPIGAAVMLQYLAQQLLKLRKEARDG